VSQLWRISRHSDLEGLGGERADGRWHSMAKGKRIVYLSEHPSLALIEMLANLKGEPRLLPESYRLLKISVEERVVRSAQTTGTLSKDWRERLSETRAVGDAWLAASSSVLLIVPSAPSPESWNYLLNPRHPDALSLQVEWSKWIDYDKRLFHLREAERET